MKNILFRPFLTLAACCLLCCAAACAPQTETSSADAQPAQTPAAMDLRDAACLNLSDLANQTQLALLDIRGHDLSVTDFDALQAALPACQIIWSVPIAGERRDSDSAVLHLSRLTQAEGAVLKYFPALNKVIVDGGDSVETAAVAAAYPGYAFSWTVDVYGTQTDSDTVSLDLTGTDVGSVEDLSRVLEALPHLQEVCLADCPMTNAEKAAVRRAFGQISFLWEVTLNDCAVDCRETALDFNASGFSTLAEVTDAIDCFAAPEQIDMTEAGFSDADMETLVQAYPGIRFIWTVHFGKYAVHTDAEVFSTRNIVDVSYRLTDEEARILRYCTDLELLDLGHNSLSDISWIAGLNKLKILILVDNQITDISALTELKDLVFVELFMNQIVDLTPLAGKEKLLDLNLCFNEAEDATPLLSDVNLERLWISHNNLTAEQQQMLEEGLTGCKFNFTTSGGTGGGWREHERYDALCRSYASGTVDPLFGD